MGCLMKILHLAALAGVISIMVISARVPYQGAEGITPAEGVPAGDALRTQASPADFGAQVGQAEEKLGTASLDTGKQWAALKAETEANQAEENYIKAQGDLKAKYSQYEGLQADAMRSKYAEESQALQAQFKSGLSPIAGKLFDNTTRRTLANNISEYSGYAAGQVKQANLKSQQALQVSAATSMGNLPSALDDAQVGAAVGKAVTAQNAISDLNGDGSIATGRDERNRLTFPDTPQGQAAAARYHEQVDNATAPIYMTAAKTIADNQGATAAATWAQKHWDMMPDKAKVEMNAYLAPKMVNEDINGAIASANAQMAANRQKQLETNVPKSPVENANQASNLLDVIHQNEGFTGKIGKDNNGANVINGINEKSFPADYATIKAAYEKGKDAGDKATNDFYQKNIIDKYNIKSLPANTQAIVADGLVNHGTGSFGQSLIDAAKSGATPQQLIDMRRQEYQRLADADTDGSKGYRASLKGWNNRLDKFQSGQQIAQPQYANDWERLTNERQAFIDNAVAAVTQKRGTTDLGIIASTEKHAAMNIDAQIKTAKLQLESDQKSVQDAIGGSLSNGRIPMTEQELRALPGMSPLLDKVQREQRAFYDSIPTRIAKAQHADATTNSPNAYDNILAVLDTSKPYSRQERIEYLSKSLGSENPGFSISQKDFNDAKAAVDLDSGRSYLSTGMKEVAEANGNLDGKGQQRAVQWYNRVMAAWKANQAKEGGNKMDEAAFFDDTSNPDLPAKPRPSRLTQLQNSVQSQIQKPPPVFTDKAQYDAAPSGTVYIRNGQQYRKP